MALVVAVSNIVTNRKKLNDNRFGDFTADWSRVESVLKHLIFLPLFPTDEDDDDDDEFLLTFSWASIYSARYDLNAQLCFL